ncbi:MAG: hypothetical protein LBP99_02805 [Azoarcus sp.]|jgi:hypothetical protein|nr:hypothetical protein [Azoarcus sp.]
MNNEEFIKVLADSTKTKSPPSSRSLSDKQLGDGASFQPEENDDFIALDFRTVNTPSCGEWITDNRDFQKGKYQKGDRKYDYFDFDWRLVNNDLFITIKINILNSHDCAHDVFHNDAADIVPSMSGMQWAHVFKPCKKNIGAVCARTAISTFFVYKNVFVKVRAIPILPESSPLRDILSEWTAEALIPKSPNGDPWDMVIAEWIYSILKTASRFKVFPAEPSPR